MRVLLIAAGLSVCWLGSSSAQDMPLTQVLMPGENWELIGEGYQFTEGPAVDKEGNVFFTDIPASRIYRISTSGKVSLFADNTNKSNGLMFGADGKLYACQNGAKRIVAWNSKGEIEVIAEGFHSNDLVVTSNGGIYFTDPSSDQVWYIPPGKKPVVVAKGFRPNGIILWPSEGTLVVTDSKEPHLWAFRILKSGELDAGEKYYLPLQIPAGKDRPGSDGMTVDEKGRLYVATHAGIQMFDPTGRLGGTIVKPQPKFLSNVVFGGEGFQYLYATCSDKVYRRKVKPKGHPTFLNTSK